MSTTADPTPRSQQLDCECELTTQHFKGEGHGHGPIASSETIVLAVFKNTPRDSETNRLTHDSFPTPKLTAGDLSIAREQYIAKAEFIQHVVAPNVEREGPLVGVATAKAGDIQALTYENGRSFCVSDKVEEGDHDSHAVISYAHNQDGISQKRKSIIRTAIRADLADTFTEILDFDKAMERSEESSSELE